MKILLKVSPTLERILADEPGSTTSRHGPPDGWSLTSTVDVQPQRRLRAKFCKPKNRDNMVTRVTFTVSVPFDDAQAAENYAQTYPTIIEREGELWCVSRLNDVETVKKLLNAVIETLTVSQFGVTIMITYNISGGQYL